jgi:hypothetical protein
MITQEFKKEDVLLSIEKSLEFGRQELNQLTIEIKQKQERTNFFNAFGSENQKLYDLKDRKEAVEFIVKKLKGIKTFLSASVSTTVSIDYQTFCKLNFFHQFPTNK